MMQFIFQGEPVAKGRPRIGKGRAYTPAKTRNAEDAIRLQAKEQGARPLSGPLGALIVFHMPIPASWSKTRQIAAIGEYHTSRPDADNLKKLVLDALNGLAWEDDAQVADIRVIKIYGKTPMTEVSIWQLWERRGG